jgi:two-component system, chemotaxis family, protein-glutamate methylesterase/glutaminase
MPHFYLHLREGERLLKDPDGREFRSLDEARVEAVLSARELMSHAWHKSGRNSWLRGDRTSTTKPRRGQLMKPASNANDFPVVCVGGSAGGLDAYIRLLQNLPADIGVAVVIVNHLRVTATLLHEILPRYTKMPVELISEGLIIRPNRVFIIPPQRDLHVLRGEFRLKPISKPRGWPDVITVFLRSLAQHWNGKLIAVIVSGYDGDGAAALCAIREVGGVTIAQKLETAEHPDMPESAIASGYVDFVLSPEGIAVEISRIAEAHPLTRSTPPQISQNARGR